MIKEEERPCYLNLRLGRTEKLFVRYDQTRQRFLRID